MPAIPIYLKTSDTRSRPTDPEFFWITRDGTFLCRNHPFFASDVLTSRPPQSLAGHQPYCQLAFPRLSAELLETIIGFFARVFELHRSEAIVLLYWNEDTRQHVLRVPSQTASVWESARGDRSPLDVTYEVPLDVPAGYRLLGDIHSHGDIGAYASYTDQSDERHRDGVHVVVGRIDQEPPEFHLEFAVDGSRFLLRFDHLFEGYRRRGDFPHEWLSLLSVTIHRPRLPLAGHGTGDTSSLAPGA